MNSARFFWVMNPAAYQRLPADLRALIDETSGVATAARIGKQLDAAEDEGSAYMKGKGVEVLTFSPALQDQMKGAVKAIVDEHIGKLEAKGEPARAFHEALSTKSGT